MDLKTAKENIKVILDAHLLGQWFKGFKAARQFRGLFLRLLCLVLMTPGILYSAQEKENHTATPLRTIIVDKYYPYTFINSRGQPDGFSVDLIRAVAKAVNLELDIRSDRWDKAKKSLIQGEIDFLPMMAYSKVRDHAFDFSPPHTIAYDAFFSRKESAAIKTPEDLHQKKIIVMAQDQAHDYLMQIEAISPDQLVFAQSIPDVLLKLSGGQGDVALIPKLVGLMQIKKMGLAGIEISPIIVEDYQRPFSFAVKEGNQVLLERLTQGLMIIKETGRYDAVYKKWFSAYEPMGMFWGRIFKYVLWCLGALIIISSMLLLWTVFLKKQVALKTISLKQEIRTRKDAEYDLQRANEKLEHRVKLRTSELKKANSQLHKEIEKRQKMHYEREKLVVDLQNAIEDIKQLSGLLPICSNCSKIRDDKGYWNKIESYIETHSEAVFSHGLCPDCMENFYGKEDWYIKMKDREEKK